MSAFSAIAAVTATLRNLLENAAHEDPELLDTTVTTQALGLARGSNTNNQLNLFLYNTTLNTAFGNAPMPRQVRNGEQGPPPLALNLKYLITAYGQANNNVNAHRLMGRSMSVLHDHPLLGSAEIEGAYPGADLHEQFEGLRITPDLLSLDDMSKLWTSFQTEYRLSTGYEVSVVLIESQRSARTPLPVLTRGENDRGAIVEPSLVPPFPTLSRIELPNRQITAFMGDNLNIQGHHLSGDTVSAVFRHPRLSEPITMLATVVSDQEITVQIPNTPADWAAWRVGFYTLEIHITRAGEQDRVSNALPLSLGTRISNIIPANPIPSGDISFTLTCHPQIQAEQRPTLLLGHREVLEPIFPTFDTLTFAAADVAVGRYYLRLRVDGVDSQLIDRSISPPTFLNAMEVIVA